MFLAILAIWLLLRPQQPVGILSSARVSYVFLIASSSFPHFQLSKLPREYTMSKEELLREQIHSRLHGVALPVDEDPPFFEMHLLDRLELLTGFFALLAGLTTFFVALLAILGGVTWIFVKAAIALWMYSRTLFVVSALLSLIFGLWLLTLALYVYVLERYMATVPAFLRVGNVGIGGTRPRF